MANRNQGLFSPDFLKNNCIITEDNIKVANDQTYTNLIHFERKAIKRLGETSPFSRFLILNVINQFMFGHVPVIDQAFYTKLLFWYKLTHMQNFNACVCVCVCVCAHVCVHMCDSCFTPFLQFFSRITT